MSSTEFAGSEDVSPLDAKDSAGMDFLVAPTAKPKVLLVLVILGHDRRPVLHISVTEHPAASGRRSNWYSLSRLNLCGAIY